MKKLIQSSFEMCAVNFPSIKFVTPPLNDLFLFCWSTLGALATESKGLFYDKLEEEDDNENSVFPALMKMEEEEEESLFSGLMKIESDEEE